MAGTAIATRSLEELEKIIAENERVEQMVVEDPEAITKQIIDQLLNAESDEELGQVGNATGWRTLIGLPVAILGFNWRPSTYDEGSTVFFVVRATRMDDGSPLVLTTGSRNVLAQIVNLAKRERFGPDCIWKLVEGSPTEAGFKPLWLEQVTPAAGKG